MAMPCIYVLALLLFTLVLGSFMLWLLVESIGIKDFKTVTNTFLR